LNTLTKKTVYFLRPVKDDLALRAPYVYCIPCQCSKVVYTGQRPCHQDESVMNIHGTQGAAEYEELTVLKCNYHLSHYVALALTIKY
jgi:hypothetical protein